MDNDRDFLLSNLINELVKDEWTAVNAYESAIATLTDTGNLDVIAILEDIRDEEYVHIGQLESCLSLLKGDPTEHIEDGSEEGFEQLELPEDDEVEEPKVETESLDLKESDQVAKYDYDEVAEVFDDIGGYGDYNDIVNELMDRFHIDRDTAQSWFDQYEMTPEEDSEDDFDTESLDRKKVESKTNKLSEKEMKKIICDMITKYDASEEEIFDELQSQDPAVSRDTARRLYKMCNQRNEKLEKVAEKPTFDDLWEELEEIGE